MKKNKYNLKRKQLLQRLDKEDKVSILELGLYDLTPYFSNDDFDISLSETIMINKNLEREITYSKELLYFSPPQYKALKCLAENDRVILSAPTSFGKTMLIKEYIYKYNPQTVVYIVPTNALAYELEKSFKENEHFSEYLIFDKCLHQPQNQMENNEEKLFFIGTQEKYLELGDDVLNKIDLFVIDEAYKLQETVKNHRAYKLAETFLDDAAQRASKFFLLTPRATFEGFDKYDFYLYESDFNAVEKKYVVVESHSFFQVLLEKGKIEKTILFCSNPKQINDVYELIKDRMEFTERNNIAKFLEDEIHPDWSVVKLLKLGILTHHGQMPKFVQNKMINLFNTNDNYNILLGTNSISEGINTVTKNLFIHPDYNKMDDVLLMKNTVGRAGRLGKYPIGYVYSVNPIEDLIENEITITLAISSEEELSEIEDCKNDEKIMEFGLNYGLDFEFVQELLKRYKISMTSLGRILESLKKDRKYVNITNLPYMAMKAMQNNYTSNVDFDTILIKGYLQNFYLDGVNKIYLNNFGNRINFFNDQYKGDKMDNTTVINLYMQFIYSTLEYSIMPLVKIGLDIYVKYPKWDFGRNVIGTLEECKKKYFRKTFGSLDYDNLTEEQQLILSAIKDYGMLGLLKNINENILDEINSHLKLRYSTTDVINAIKFLAENSKNNQEYYKNVMRKYLL